MQLTLVQEDLSNEKIATASNVLRGGFRVWTATTAATPAQDLNKQAGPPMLGIHWARGFEPYARLSREVNPAARPSRSPNMTYHGGKIMPTATTQAIFWGTSWRQLLRR